MAIVESVPTPAGAPRRLALASPVDGRSLGEIEVTPPDGVVAALERARKAQPEWGTLPVEERARILWRVLDLVVEQQDSLVETIIAETGKTTAEALQIDIFAACDSLSYYAKRAAQLLSSEKRRLHGVMRFMKKLQVHYRPLGVVGVISPWNGPFIMPMNPTAQALVAGNAVLLKPSEITPFSGQKIGDLFHEAGLPEGLLQVLPGDGETGAALTSAGVDKVCFTGSVSTGRKVAVACAERLTPCTLELGGKDPMIVCADADVPRAAAGALAGGFANTGQYCCGTERIYVVDEVADEFIDCVVERASQLRQGGEGEFDVGAICWPNQLDIIDRHVADATAKGASIRVGGRRNPDLDGCFYEPTVITDVDHEMLIMQEETFGPILPIMRVADEEEAMRLANDTSYGLSATIWSKDEYKAMQLAKRIESGGVCINDMTVTYGVPEAPFGGLKDSGVGQVNGPAGLRGYCHTMPVITDRWGGRQLEDYYPFTRQKDETLRKTVRLLYGTSIGRFFS
jgi:acyl-CoA reductase-like NAD-dependent aldehyde dehydrogenase